MVSRINKLIAALLLVSLSLYVVVLNPQPAVIHFSGDSSLETYGGVLFIGVFVAGFLAAALLALFFGFKAHLRERKLEGRERQRLAFYDGVVKARSYLASEEFTRAREQWEGIIKKDPTNIVARVELSRSLEGLGNTAEALRVLDAARAADPTNVEVLFRAAEINRTLGNKTAAVDNLALALHHHPSRRAAALARDLSAELGRFGDALEYNARLETLGEPHSNVAEAATSLQFKKLIDDFGKDPTSLEKELRNFLKKSPTFIPALERLAAIEASNGRIEESAQLLAKAARTGGGSEHWHTAARLWIAQQHPDRALSAARAAVTESKGEARITAELNLIRLYLDLNMIDQGRKALDDLPMVAKENRIPLSDDITRRVTALRGICLARSGNFKEAAELWPTLIPELDSLRSEKAPLKAGSDGPSPVLSTP